MIKFSVVVALDSYGAETGTICSWVARIMVRGDEGKDRFDISDTQAGQSDELKTDMIFDYEQGETLIIAPNQGTVWYRKVSGDPKFGGNKYIYIFNSQAAAVENIYVRLRNFEGTIDSSVFLSDGIDQVELVRLPDII